MLAVNGPDTVTSVALAKILSGYIMLVGVSYTTTGYRRTTFIVPPMGMARAPGRTTGSFIIYELPSLSNPAVIGLTFKYIFYGLTDASATVLK